MTMLVLFFVAGALTWTLAEYCLHRWVGHRRTGALWFTLDHRAHHRDGNVFASLGRKIASGVVVVTGLFAALVWPLGVVWGGCFCLGFGGGYSAYEWLHWSLHQHGPSTAYGRWARRHHFYHHFHDPHRNHGVSSPLWDLVFGTHVSARRIRVPRQQRVRWLLDQRLDTSAKALGGDYVMVASKRTTAS